MNLDPKRVLRPAEAAVRLGVSKATLWRAVRLEPGFPQPRHVTARASVFLVTELDAWVDAPERLLPNASSAVAMAASKASGRHRKAPLVEVKS